MTRVEEELLEILHIQKSKIENLSHLVDSLEDSLAAQHSSARHYYALWEDSYNAHRRVLNLLADDSIRDHEVARNKAIQVVNDALRQRL